jgi:hypothetical protein
MAHKLLSLAMRTALRMTFRAHRKPDGTLLKLCPDVTIGLGDPKGVIQQAL